MPEAEMKKPKETKCSLKKNTVDIAITPSAFLNLHFDNICLVEQSHMTVKPSLECVGFNPGKVEVSNDRGCEFKDMGDASLPFSTGGGLNHTYHITTSTSVIPILNGKGVLSHAKQSIFFELRKLHVDCTQQNTMGYTAINGVPSEAHPAEILQFPDNASFSSHLQSLLLKKRPKIMPV
ncbi:hypothetical protein BDR05DRAFT_953066 [Suillus weaverae]|nr:hypothetical protein BDR05DRAFT_953777 [Suillus weaverae]KAG2336818.1 hypothetical protein BDR05DRAFT_953066 [Suillus weaverae]